MSWLSSHVSFIRVMFWIILIYYVVHHPCSTDLLCSSPSVFDRSTVKKPCLNGGAESLRPDGLKSRTLVRSHLIFSTVFSTVRFRFALSDVVVISGALWAPYSPSINLVLYEHHDAVATKLLCLTRSWQTLFSWESLFRQWYHTYGFKILITIFSPSYLPLLHSHNEFREPATVR